MHTKSSQTSPHPRHLLDCASSQVTKVSTSKGWNQIPAALQICPWLLIFLADTLLSTLLFKLLNFPVWNYFNTFNILLVMIVIITKPTNLHSMTDISYSSCNAHQTVEKWLSVFPHLRTDIYPYFIFRLSLFFPTRTNLYPKSVFRLSLFFYTHWYVHFWFSIKFKLFLSLLNSIF